MKIKWEDLTEAHVQKMLEMGAVQEKDNALIGEKWYTSGPAYVLLIDGEIALCMGGVKEDRVGEIWMVPTPLFHKKRIACYKAVIALMDWAKGRFGVDRYQCIVDESDIKAQRWAMHFGFKEVRRVENCNNSGKTMILFVKE